MGRDAGTARTARDRLYAIIQDDAPFEEKAREALALGVEYLDADNGHLARVDPGAGHWEVVVTTDPPDGRFPQGLELDLAQTYCRRTLETGATVALSDAPEQGWADDPAFETHGLHCYHGTPLLIDGEPYGTVCFVADDPRTEFSDGETMFAELVAKLLERELEREHHETALTRQTNLAVVLNRVLRHNLRNDMSVIRGFTELMADELDEDPYSATALENIDDLIQLGEKARDLDRIVAADAEYESTDVAALVEAVVDRISAEYPQATFTTESEGDPVAPVLPSFERALEELVENAAKHGGGDPSVTVTTTDGSDGVEVRIADSGPGLASHEAAVLETGAETPLTHGSGLGLWLAHWVVTSHDGSIEATVDGGTTMTISLPRTTTPTVHRQLSELTRARDQYEAAFEEANDAMVIVDDDARILHANPEASTIYGLDRQALLGQPLQRFLPETLEFASAWEAFRRAGRVRDTVTVHGADGVERRVEYAATSDIVPGQHLVVSRDVTERVEREAELARKTQAMDEAPVGITITDPHREDNPIVYANERFSDLTGYDETAVLGRNCRFLQGPETDPASVATLRRAIEAREPVTETILNYRTDGTTFWNRVTVAPVVDASGDLTNFVGFQEDVTERVERERALGETTRRLQAVIDASPNAILALDADGTVRLWNEAAETLFGYGADAVLGESIRSLGIHGDDHSAEFEAQFERSLAGETFTDHVISRQTRTGERVRLSLSTAPITDATGTVTGVVGVAAAVTDATDPADGE